MPNLPQQISNLNTQATPQTIPFGSKPIAQPQASQVVNTPDVIPFGSKPVTGNEAYYNNMNAARKPLEDFKQYSTDVDEARKQGIQQIESGFQQFHNAGANPFAMLESGVTGAAGVVNTVLSPIAPLFKPLSKLINFTGDKISDIKAVQDFAQSDAGKIISRAAEDIANLSNVASAVGGAEVGVEGIKTGETPEFTGRTAPEVVETPEQPAAPKYTDADIAQARSKIADVYKDVLPFTKREQGIEASLLQNKGENTYSTLAKYQISPASDTAIEDLDGLSNMFEQTVNEARKSEPTYFNMDEVKANARQSIIDNFTSADERKAAFAKLESELTSLKEEESSKYQQNAQGKDIAPSEVIERLRKTGNDWVYQGRNKFNPDSIKGGVGKAIGDAVRDQVEKEGKFPGYRNASREWSNIIHAKEMLENLSESGKKFKVPGGLAGSISRKMLSGMFGFSKAGIMGAVIAELGQEFVYKTLANPDLRTYFERRLLEKASDGKVTSKELEQLKEEIKTHMKEVNDRAKSNLLPPGSKPEPGTAGNPFITPEPGKSTIKSPIPEPPMARPAKVISVKNPKTGKFERVFTSEEKGKGSNPMGQPKKPTQGGSKTKPQ